MPSQSWTEPGQHEWIVPPGVTSLTVELWGPGGAGGFSGCNNAGRGGTGGTGGVGAYLCQRNYSVTPGEIIAFFVGIPDTAHKGHGVTILYCDDAGTPKLVAGSGGEGGWGGDGGYHEGDGGDGGDGNGRNGSSGGGPGGGRGGGEGGSRGEGAFADGGNAGYGGLGYAPARQHYVAPGGLPGGRAAASRSGGGGGAGGSQGKSLYWEGSTVVDQVNRGAGTDDFPGLPTACTAAGGAGGRPPIGWGRGAPGGGGNGAVRITWP